MNATGDLFIADRDNSRVRRVDGVTGQITTNIGFGEARYNGDGIPAVSAQLNAPWGAACDRQGNLFIADRENHRVRRVDVATGRITTVAGTGVAGFNGDEQLATAAQLHTPLGVTVDESGNLFIADEGNHRVRRVDAGTGLISTIAGTGVGGYNGDEIASAAAQLFRPSAVALDGLGNIFIADSFNFRIRLVNLNTGLISTVAGTGTSGYNGDDKPATMAHLFGPEGVAVDRHGNLFVADQSDNRIRRVDAETRVISTVAGTGVRGDDGDGGPATAARIDRPIGVAVDAEGNVFFTDSFNFRIRRVDVQTERITTVAGTGVSGFRGDGRASVLATVSGACGVAFDSVGNLYVADSGNHAIRAIKAIGIPVDR